MPPPSVTLTKPLGAGIATWLTSCVLLVAAAWPLTKAESVSSALMWSFGYWWVAYGAGLIALLAVSARARLAPVRAMAAYLVPMAIVAALIGICLLIYPDDQLQEELFGYLPIALVFYVFGYIWTLVRRDPSIGSTTARAMLPPVLGGVLIVAFVAVPVFTGNAFVYRNAFVLKVDRIDRPAGELIADGVLEIRKPGSYSFSAPWFLIQDAMMGPDMENFPQDGIITWGAPGAPPPGSTGSFPLRIRWENVKVRPEMVAPGNYDYPRAVVIQVHDTKLRGNILCSVSGPMPE